MWRTSPFSPRSLCCCVTWHFLSGVFHSRDSELGCFCGSSLTISDEIISQSSSFFSVAHTPVVGSSASTSWAVRCAVQLPWHRVVWLGEGRPRASEQLRTLSPLGPGRVLSPPRASPGRTLQRVSSLPDLELQDPQVLLLLETPCERRAAEGASVPWT